MVSNCIITERLSNSTHSKDEHSKDSLIHDNTSEIAIINNLYSCNMRRNPFFKGGTQGIVANNYIYNPGSAAIHYNLSRAEWKGHEWVTGKMTVIGNYIEFGKDTRKGISTGIFSGPVELYWKDNPELSKPATDNLSGSHTLVDTLLVWLNGFKVVNSSKVKDYVLVNAGARPWDRDETDKRIVQEVKNKTGKIIDSEQEVGGYPQTKPVFEEFNADEWDLVKMIKK